MIYVHQDVPAKVSRIFVPRADRYMELLNELGRYLYDFHRINYSNGILRSSHPLVKRFLLSKYNPEAFDGFPCCGVVSRVVSLALCDSNVDSTIVRGAYPLDNTDIGHSWLRVSFNRKDYSIDMTHKQVGSEDMVVIAPSSIEEKFNLKMDALVQPEKCRSIVDIECMTKSRYVKELYDLFRN